MNDQHLATAPVPYRLTVLDFLMLDTSGAFVERGKTELIQGEILCMNAQHRPHARAKGALYLELTRALDAAAIGLGVLIEATVTMPPLNAPEPDLVITDEPGGDGPVPLSSVRLVIEIADTTLAYDLDRKAQLYAEHGVPEYWVYDLGAKVIHQMWSPVAGTYMQSRQIAAGARIMSATVTGLAIDLPDF